MQTKYFARSSVLPQTASLDSTAFIRIKTSRIHLAAADEHFVIFLYATASLYTNITLERPPCPLV